MGVLGDDFGRIRLNGSDLENGAGPMKTEMSPLELCARDLENGVGP